MPANAPAFLLGFWVFGPSVIHDSFCKSPAPTAGSVGMEMTVIPQHGVRRSACALATVNFFEYLKPANSESSLRGYDLQIPLCTYELVIWHVLEFMTSYEYLLRSCTGCPSCDELKTAVSHSFLLDFSWPPGCSLALDSSDGIQSCATANLQRRNDCFPTDESYHASSLAEPADDRFPISHASPSTEAFTTYSSPQTAPHPAPSNPFVPGTHFSSSPYS